MHDECNATNRPPDAMQEVGTHLITNEDLKVFNKVVDNDKDRGCWHFPDIAHLHDTIGHIPLVCTQEQQKRQLDKPLLAWSQPMQMHQGSSQHRKTTMHQ